MTTRIYSPATRLLDIYNGLDLFLGNTIQEDNKILSFDVPGFSKDDLSVVIDQDEALLTIKAEKEVNGKTRTINKSIRDYSFRNLDLKKVEAKVENGILTIDLSSAEDKSKLRKKQISLN
jgi:HSP20 family molecular chaperone IbpA